MPARVLAFFAIVVAGLCGGLIGDGVVEVQCTGNCTTAAGIGLLLTFIGLRNTGLVVGLVIGVALSVYVAVIDARKRRALLRVRPTGCGALSDTEQDTLADLLERAVRPA